MENMDLDTMTVKNLKQQLSQRGLKQSGLKAQLKERLREAMEEELINSNTDNTGPSGDATPPTTEGGITSGTGDNLEEIEAGSTSHTDFADFEEYINDEYNRINANNATPPTAATLDEFDTVSSASTANHKEATNTHPHEEEEEEETAETTEIPMDAPASETTPSKPEKSSKSAQSRMEERIMRFGTKRPLEAVSNVDDTCPALKKQRLAADRSKIIERAQKFGTTVPKGLKLTQAESAVVYADQIERAKRFGTEHLLPAPVKAAELDAKKAERKKRFQNTESAACSESSSDAAVTQVVPDAKARLMERKMRFGTLDDGDKKSKRQERFGTQNGAVSKKRKQQGGRRGGRRGQRGQRGRRTQRGVWREVGTGQVVPQQGWTGNQRGNGRYSNGQGRGGYQNAQNGQRTNGFNGQAQNAAAKVQFSPHDLQKINQRKMRFS